MPNLQSPWIIDGHRKGVSSVEERIADAVLPAFQADRHKFMSAGMQPSALSQCKHHPLTLCQPGAKCHYLLSVICSLAVMCESVCTTADLWQLSLPSRRLSCACHSDVICCVAQCLGALDMQLAFIPHVPASGMHGQKKNSATITSLKGTLQTLLQISTTKM